VQSLSIRWQKGTLIGHGAFGKVYLGMNVETAELMAVKEIPVVSSSETSSDLETFKSEVALLKGPPPAQLPKLFRRSFRVSDQRAAPLSSPRRQTSTMSTSSSTWG
jgi:hypothetical protein